MLVVGMIIFIFLLLLFIIIIINIIIITIIIIIADIIIAIIVIVTIVTLFPPPRKTGNIKKNKKTSTCHCVFLWKGRLSWPMAFAVCVDQNILNHFNFAQFYFLY